MKQYEITLAGVIRLGIPEGTVINRAYEPNRLFWTCIS